MAGANKKKGAKAGTRGPDIIKDQGRCSSKGTDPTKGARNHRKFDRQKKPETKIAQKEKTNENSNEQNNKTTPKLDFQKAYCKFCKTSDSLPERLQKKLDNMPMNKGYKFREVIFFGMLPADGETNVIFERINKNTMYIHTWEKDFTYKYEKKGKNKKVLLEKIPRKGSFNSQDVSVSPDKDFVKSKDLWTSKV